MNDVYVVIHPSGWLTLIGIAVLIFSLGVTYGIIMSNNCYKKEDKHTFDFEKEKQ